MIGLVRAVLVDPLPYAHSEELVWIYTDNSAVLVPPLGCRLPGARSRSSDVQRRRGLSDELRHRVRPRIRRARRDEGSDRLVLPAARPAAADRPSLRSVGRQARRANRGPDRCLLGATLRARSRRAGAAARASTARRTRSSACWKERSVRWSTTSACSRRRTGRRRRGRGRFSRWSWRAWVQACRGPRRFPRCARPTPGSFRSGGRRIRTRRRRGDSRTSRPAWSARSARRSTWCSPPSPAFCSSPARTR